MKKQAHTLALWGIFLAILLPTQSYAQGVGIGTAAPHASSALDVTSITRGLLPPRMTTVQRNAIGSPAQGLLIYNTTTNCINFYNGAVWLELCGSPVCGFLANLASSSITGAQGGTATATVNLSVTGGPPTLTTSVLGLPVGISVASITNNPTSASGTQTITFNIGAAVPLGNYNVTVRVVGTCGVSPVNLPLTITVTTCVNSTSATTANVLIGRYDNGPSAGVGTFTINIPPGASTFRLMLMSYEATNWVITGAVSRLTAVHMYAYDAGGSISGQGAVPTTTCTESLVAACPGGCSPYAAGCPSMGNCPCHIQYAACIWGIPQAQVSHVSQASGCDYPAWTCMNVMVP